MIKETSLHRNQKKKWKLNIGFFLREQLSVERIEVYWRENWALFMQ